MKTKIKAILDKWLPDMFPEQSQSKEYFVNELENAFTEFMEYPNSIMSDQVKKINELERFNEMLRRERIMNQLNIEKIRNFNSKTLWQKIVFVLNEEKI